MALFASTVPILTVIRKTTIQEDAHNQSMSTKSTVRKLNITIQIRYSTVIEKKREMPASWHENVIQGWPRRCNVDLKFQTVNNWIEITAKNNCFQLQSLQKYKLAIVERTLRILHCGNFVNVCSLMITTARIDVHHFLEK